VGESRELQKMEVRDVRLELFGSFGMSRVEAVEIGDESIADLGVTEPSAAKQVVRENELLTVLALDGLSRVFYIGNELHLSDLVDQLHLGELVDKPLHLGGRACCDAI
jgi:hypothetical protein